MATNPMKIRAANKDGVTEVKVLISHEMETGQRKDSVRRGHSGLVHYRPDRQAQR